jgi:hypothetical protein
LVLSSKGLALRSWYVCGSRGNVSNNHTVWQAHGPAIGDARTHVHEAWNPSAVQSGRPDFAAIAELYPHPPAACSGSPCGRADGRR